MLRAIGRALDHRMTVAEYLGVLILIGIPYGIFGVFWTLTHMSHLSEVDGTWNQIVSFLGAIVCWPVLTFSNVTMT